MVDESRLHTKYFPRRTAGSLAHIRWEKFVRKSLGASGVGKNLWGGMRVEKTLWGSAPFVKWSLPHPLKSLFLFPHGAGILLIRGGPKNLPSGRARHLKGQKPRLPAECVTTLKTQAASPATAKHASRLQEVVTRATCRRHAGGTRRHAGKQKNQAPPGEQAKRGSTRQQNTPAA